MTNAPIVSPWFFYWMSVCGSLDILLTVVGGIIAIGAGIVGLVTFVDQEWQILRISCKWLTVGLIILCLAILCPNEKTLMQMAVANYVTPENVSNAYQVVLDVTNDLLGLVP